VRTRTPRSPIPSFHHRGPHKVPGAGHPCVRTWAWPTHAAPDVRIHASRKGAEKRGAESHSQARHDGARNARRIARGFPASVYCPFHPDLTVRQRCDRTRRHGAAPPHPGSLELRRTLTPRRAASLTHASTGNLTRPPG
jgi:hypothetical protein